MGNQIKKTLDILYSFFNYRKQEKMCREEKIEEKKLHCSAYINETNQNIYRNR